MVVFFAALARRRRRSSVYTLHVTHMYAPACICVYIQSIGAVVVAN